jgi:hypothetical protein
VTTYQPEPCCRFCGAGPANLHSVEASISWRYVNWEHLPAAPDQPIPGRTDGAVYPGHPAGWYTGDDWGDDVGDSDTESIGVACGNCYTVVRWDEDPERRASDLITTRRAYNRAHPVRLWRVELHRIVTPAKYESTETPDPDYPNSYRITSVKLADEVKESKVVEVRARDAREAMESSWTQGMAPDGTYPWVPMYGAQPEPVECRACLAPATRTIDGYPYCADHDASVER